MSTRNRAGARFGTDRVDLGEDARRGTGERHQQRQPQPERHRQPAGGGAGPVERGDAEPRDRAAEMLRSARDAPDREAEQREQAAQDGDRGRARGGEPGVAGAADGDRCRQRERQTRAG